MDRVPPKGGQRSAGKEGWKSADGQKTVQSGRQKSVPPDGRNAALAGRRMSVPRDGREAALNVLSAVRRNGAWADSALHALLDRARLSPADAALCSRIVYGVLQNQILLDFYLNAFCKQRVDHLQSPLPDILRLGAYQILFLDRVPDRAAVGEAVELAKRSGQSRAAGLVNAVLRNLSRNRDALPALPGGLNGLSVRYSHPLWLVERTADLVGVEEAEAFLAADNTVPPVTVQVNPLRVRKQTERARESAQGTTAVQTDETSIQTAVSELITELSAAGVAVRPHAWVPGCLELDGAGDPAGLEAFRAGRMLVQDPAARLVTLAACIGPGQNVLDVCAAPGGKTFSAAIAIEGQGKVLACDIHANKLRRVREGAERLGLADRVETVQADGREHHPEWDGAFDTVLVDAPCSGLGVIRKKPDIRYKNHADFAALRDSQSAILANAARYVKPGGTLVYSTCTILPEENQGVTDRFLSEHPAFVRRPFRLPEGFPGERETDGSLTLWPHRHGTDGFYLCVMERRE